MRKEVEFTQAKFIITKDELGYSDVLEDFSKSKFIYIVTYNISKNIETLLDKLRDVPGDTNIKLFTNIPNRFNGYIADWASKNAKNLINIYVTKLDPKKFNENFKSQFVFNNHAKIIMTNNIAYIGSANYSSESANNFEAGVIIEDKVAILQIKDIIDEEVEGSAEPYYAYDIFPLIFLARELEEIRTILNESIWGLWEIRGHEQGEYYKGGNIYIDTKILEAFECFQDDLDTLVSELIQEIENNTSDKDLTYDKEELIERLDNLKEFICKYEIDSEVIEFIEYDEDSYINNLIQENAIYMTEDVLDDYVQDFIQQAFEIKEELATNAREAFIAFDSFLTQATQTVMDRVDDLRGIINERIDNT
ncbi:phospholipase D-like domain-containing protein [Sporosarcina saromensis]|uniref:Phospholipase D-like domain-containing protein n=1 Tax=Sporosarcina saromensis TaxID=359365 RepID=A0ABU4GFJ1_9BACL|nr:phospholipase D-like domain-containing protein [Sporosarcina saromensis]MDW0115060.1 phospholipase D-like domain-containing protein [Sporosarcina saromensis]